ncbi:AAA family ATPase [Chryseobacterium balustinum]|nr:AAA family ATPase [Chryseobacterium balustinum]
MNTEWLNLRPFNGDIKNGFEELVCQLARTEEIQNRKKFIRVAAPDGGVESYCVLDNGDEYGWQAKYFSSMADSQWKQLTKSFKKAIEKHPNLTRYYICIPLDRQDPRLEDQKWFMDRWNDYVKEWTDYANSLGKSVEFIYWGNSEIFDRLAKPVNEGKIKFWFQKDEFSDSWFKKKLNHSILNLEKRYTPDNNVDLPIAKIFDGLARDSFFQKQFNNYYHDFIKKLKRVYSLKLEGAAVELCEKIQTCGLSVVNEIDSIDFEEVSFIDKEKIVGEISVCEEFVENLIGYFYKMDYEVKQERKTNNQYNSPKSTYNSQIRDCNNLISAISELHSFLNSPTVFLSNTPRLILSGEVGVGKSHLLADIAKIREKRGQYSILLLGQHFSTAEDPWSQIKKLLDLSGNVNEFLGALNAKAESTTSRLIIFIDAINEGLGKTIWKNHLLTFLDNFSRFPNVGVVLSVRKSYERMLVSEAIHKGNIALRIQHYGFSNHEYDATKIYFRNHGIKEPSIPLLHPEFSNPLFLRLFCEGLSKKGLQEIPDGYEGITKIMDFFLDAVNEAISDKHNIPVKLNLVQKIVQKIAEEIMETNNSFLPFDHAFDFIIQMKECNSVKDKSQFFQDIISEGVLTENVLYKDSEHVACVYISYERFSDHLIAKYYIEKYLNQKNPKSSFSKDSNLVKGLKKIGEKLGFKFTPKKLLELIKDEYSADDKKGIIEALSIQLPEVIGRELYDLVPKQVKEFSSVADSLLQSIIWRRADTISKTTEDYINETVKNKVIHYNQFFSTILQVSANPKNHFNSDFLHHKLSKLSMADRDAWWIRFVNEHFEDYYMKQPQIKRLINWSWNEYPKDFVSDESIQLLSQMIVWLLGSSNRVLRDSATKALVCLLEDRIPVLINLINKFSDVNDSYILQRIYAVAYGCALRTNDKNQLKNLGECVYENIFSKENIIPDILLRDYARGVIEFAIYNGHDFNFDTEKVRPPYRSILPESFPTNEEIDQYTFEYNDTGYKPHYRSQNQILKSMITEYGRSTGGYGDFGRYVFQSGLSRWRIDENVWSNLAVQWIFEKYGYDVNKHGYFDNEVDSSGRHDHRTERIGKKYQWIAFYEILAIVSDHYHLYENYYSKDAEPINYEGPWSPYVRDIDPTIIMKDNPDDKQRIFWWNPVNFSYTDDQPLDEWIFDRTNFPSLKDIVQVTDENGVEWLVLESYPDWIEPSERGEEEFDSERKRLFFMLSSYIIEKSEKKQLLDYLQNRELAGIHIPEVSSRYELFSREYYWSTAEQTFTVPYYHGETWTELYDEKSSYNYMGQLARTTIFYNWEEEFDASKTQPISFHRPTRFLFDILELKYSAAEGTYVNDSNEVICFDPNTTTSTISSLLVRKKDLLEALEKNDLDIIWASMGEKLTIGGDFRSWNGRLNIYDILHFGEENVLQQNSFFKEERRIDK